MWIELSGKHVLLLSWAEGWDCLFCCWGSRLFTSPSECSKDGRSYRDEQDSRDEQQAALRYELIHGSTSQDRPKSFCSTMAKLMLRKQAPLFRDKV